MILYGDDNLFQIKKDEPLMAMPIFHNIQQAVLCWTVSGKKSKIYKMEVTELNPEMLEGLSIGIEKGIDINEVIKALSTKRGS